MACASVYHHTITTAGTLWVWYIWQDQSEESKYVENLPRAFPRIVSSVWGDHSALRKMINKHGLCGLWCAVMNRSLSFWGPPETYFEPELTSALPVVDIHSIFWLHKHYVLYQSLGQLLFHCSRCFNPFVYTIHPMCVVVRFKPKFTMPSNAITDDCTVYIHLYICPWMSLVALFQSV